jgi:hypothetical protein
VRRRRGNQEPGTTPQDTIPVTGRGNLAIYRPPTDPVCSYIPLPPPPKAAEKVKVAPVIAAKAAKILQFFNFSIFQNHWHTLAIK